MKRWKGVAAWIVIVCTLALLALGAWLIVSNLTKPRTTVSIGGAAFKVLIARDERAWDKGLLDRNRLDRGEGLLFVFKSDGPQNISTQMMKFDTDIIWMDSSKRVVQVAHAAAAGAKTPYASKQPARYVLQVQSGAAATAQITAGTTAAFDLP